MKIGYGFFIVLFLFGVVWAQQPLFEDNFDYPANTNLTDYGWTAHSGAGNNPIQVVSPGLIYSGYPGTGIGNAVSLISSTSSAEDDNHNFSEQTSGGVYAAFMVNVSDAPTVGTYFFHLGPTTLGTTFRGKVFAQQDGSNNLAFGIAKANNADVVYSSYTYALNTTYLIVMEYVFNGGSADDVIKLWVNPDISGNEPPADVTQTDSGSDADNLGTVALRQGSGGAALVLDGIRIGTTWQSVTSGTVVNPPVISSLTSDPFPANQAFDITCDVTIATGAVDSVKLFYYTDLDPANTDSMLMTYVSGDQYSANLNGLPNATSLDYWVKAWGNSVSSISGDVKVIVGIPDISIFHLQLDPDGLPLTLGYLARLRGIVTVSSGIFSTTNYDFYIQDNTGGIDVFNFGIGSTVYSAGDELEVVGSIDHYRGKLEILNFQATVLSTGNPVPQPIGIGIEDMGEEYEGRLIRFDNVNLVSGTWFVNPPDTNYNLTINDGTGDLTLRIVGSTDIGGNPEPSWPVSVVGIGTQFVSSAPYFGGYQIQPRAYSDFITTGISDPKPVVTRYRLEQNYPNPFNPKTTIRYELKSAGKVSLRVFNILGQQVYAFSAKQSAGAHSVAFDGSKVPSGIYFYKLEAGDFQAVKKMILAK